MPYNIADPGRDINDLIVRQAHVFREKQGIDLRTAHRVEELDPASRMVKGKILKGKAFQIPYDKLLVATGASPIIPDLPGFDLPGVMALKNLEDGRKIKNYLHDQNVKKVIIIGMGYIALEMCEALHDRHIAVDMVKPGPVFLPWMNGALAEMVEEEVESHGISMHMGQEIKGIEKGNGALRVVCSHMELEGQMVLVAVGIKPNSELAAAAGLGLGPKESIAVDSSLRTSDENIYSAGDCADAYHVVTGRKTWIPLALWANRGGWAVADNVGGKEVKLQGVAGTAAFKVLGLQVARTGLSAAEAEKSGFEPVESVIQASTRGHLHPGGSTMAVQMVGDRESGLLLGCQMVAKEGAAHRINAPAVALHAKMTLEQFSQSDLAYAPPFGPTWDPVLTAANQLLKKM